MPSGPRWTTRPSRLYTPPTILAAPTSSPNLDVAPRRRGVVAVRVVAEPEQRVAAVAVVREGVDPPDPVGPHLKQVVNRVKYFEIDERAGRPVADVLIAAADDRVDPGDPPLDPQVDVPAERGRRPPDLDENVVVEVLKPDQVL